MLLRRPRFRFNEQPVQEPQPQGEAATSPSKGGANLNLCMPKSRSLSRGVGFATLGSEASSLLDFDLCVYVHMCPRIKTLVFAYID